MNPGDLVLNHFSLEYGCGVLLRVDVDKKLLSNPWAVPWRYTVFWSDGIKREHESGVIRRVWINRL